jgi:hypothetical protein
VSQCFPPSLPRLHNSPLAKCGCQKHALDLLPAEPAQASLLGSATYMYVDVSERRLLADIKRIFACPFACVQNQPTSLSPFNSTAVARVAWLRTTSCSHPSGTTAHTDMIPSRVFARAELEMHRPCCETHEHVILSTSHRLGKQLGIPLGRPMKGARPLPPLTFAGHNRGVAHRRSGCEEERGSRLRRRDRRPHLHNSSLRCNQGA